MQPPQGPYQPSDYQPYSSGQNAAPQWTQVPVPGQGVQGQMPYQQSAPGQVPPPAQLDPVVMGVSPDGNPPVAQPYFAPQGQQGAVQAGIPLSGQNPAAQPFIPVQGQNGFGQVPPPLASPEAPKTPGQNAYQAPKTGMPRPGKRKVKTGKVILVVAVLFFCVAVVLRMISPGQVAYGYVEAGNLNGRYTGDAVIVRDETVYAQQGVSQIDYEAEEGALLKRGNSVATIYTSGFSNKEWVTLNNYRTQIKEYHKSLISAATTDTKLLSLMTKVKDRALEAQQLVQGLQGSLVNQEMLIASSMQERQIYLKQKYPDDQKLSRLYNDENAQLQRISNWSKQYAAHADGLISFYTDGFENALNMNTYGEYSPAQVRSMYKGVIPQTGETAQRNTVPIYRLVRQNSWMVLMLCNEMEWTPVTGRTYQLLIESFDNTIVSATVESFTRSGGELLVRLKVSDPSALSNVLYMRSCRVQLGESVNTLKVPSRAIFIQGGSKGVVMSTDMGEYWTGVEVISDDGTDAYIIPQNSGVLYEGLKVRLF